MFLKVIYFLKPTVPFDRDAMFANRSTEELKFEIIGPSRKSPILWENLVKQFVDGLEESSEYFL